MTGRALGVGIIGFGMVGRTHAAAYAAAERAGYGCRLRAIHSRSLGAGAGGAAAGNLGQLGGEVTLPPDLRITGSVDELLDDQAIGLVSICTHTDSHVALALRALEAGKHVLVEKPVALTAAAIRPLVLAAAEASTLCMPAMCMRFWPGWPWLRDRVLDGVFGEVRAASFERLAPPQSWAPHFYGDRRLSGGALHDLHVHDVDFVRWSFGDPSGVTAAGDVDHVKTLYRYRSGPGFVAAEGGIVTAPGFSFRMRYRVVFDDAVADFNLDREPPLLLTRSGSTGAVALESGDAYVAQVEHLLGAIRDGRRELRASLEEAEAVACILEAEQASLLGGTVWLDAE